MNPDLMRKFEKYNRWISWEQHDVRVNIELKLSSPIAKMLKKKRVVSAKVSPESAKQTGRGGKWTTADVFQGFQSCNTQKSTKQMKGDIRASPESRKSFPKVNEGKNNPKME